MDYEQAENKKESLARGYYIVYSWMISELGLKGKELIIYAIIYGFMQNSDGGFTGSHQYLADWSSSTPQVVSRALKNMLETGLILKEKVIHRGRKTTKYICTADLYKNGFEWSKNGQKTGKSDLPKSQEELILSQHDLPKKQVDLTFCTDKKSTFCQVDLPKKQVDLPKSQEELTKKSNNNIDNINNINNIVNENIDDDDNDEIPLYNTELKSVLRYYEENLIAYPGKFIIDKIADWLNDVDSDLIKFAIEKAAAVNAKWNYAESVLKQKIRDGITTGQEARQREKEIAGRKSNQSGGDAELQYWN